MRVVLLWLSLACLLSLAPPASAEDAGSWFQQGTEAYAKGDYLTAARAFERAHALRPHAAALFNRARSLEKLGDTPRAADAYTAALGRRELRPADKVEAEERLAALSSTLGSIEVTGTVGTRGSVGHVAMTHLPIRSYLMTGRYELSLLRGDGQAATITVAIRGGELTRIVLPDKGAPWPQPGPAVARSAAEAEPPRFERRFRVPAEAYVAIATAGVALAFGAYLGSEGLQARSDFEASRRTDEALRDRAVGLRTWANVAFGAALVSAIAGGALVYRASTQVVAVRLSAAPTSDRLPLQLDISGRF